jgi:hypothetical protein
LFFQSSYKHDMLGNVSHNSGETVNSINNLSVAMRPASVQAERLKALPQKDAYNQFVDSVLGSPQFNDAGSVQSKELARMARQVAPSLPDSDSRFKLYQACFDSAVTGTLPAIPGAAAAMVAKLVLNDLSAVDEKSRDEIAINTLDAIQIRANSSPEAMSHADFALQAAGSVPSTSRSVILQNGLGVIADLGSP